MQHSSARSLARCPYFNSWATGALLRQREIPLDAATTEFNQLTVFKLPKHFTYHPKVSQNGEGDFYASLKEWASNNTGSVHNPKHDPDKLGEVSKNLSLAYWITCDAVDSKASESAQRRGVDILVQLAFAIRLGANHEVRSAFKFSAAIHNQRQLGLNKSSRYVEARGEEDPLVPRP